MKKILLPLAFFFTATLISCSDTGTGPETGNGGEYSVSVTVTPSGAGTISPSSDATYEEGEKIELQAKANEGYLFTGWSGDVESADNPLTLTVSQDYALTATFEKKSYPLTVNTQGEGAVSEEIVEQKAKEYGHGTVVKLTASPANGYEFVEWTGDVTGTAKSVEITVDGAKEVTAVFMNLFEGGSGTEADPFQISTVEQLQNIDKFKDAHFIQVNDIVATQVKDWNNGKGFKPIGTFTSDSDKDGFKGSYDGQGYRIEYLTINRKSENYVGLFGYVEGGTIQNIVLRQIDVTGAGTTGGLVGYNDQGMVKNVFIAGSVKCSNDGCGGLTGLNDGIFDTYGIVENSSAEVTVTSIGDKVGGLIGTAGYYSTVEGSVAMGSVTGGLQTGGMVGRNMGSVTKSYSHAQITGESSVGGVIGMHFGDLSYSYATGKVTSGASGGGLVGYFGAGGNSVHKCYWDKESTGMAEGIGFVNPAAGDVTEVTGLATAQMTGSAAETNMPDFDFVNIWKTVPGGYPALFWE